MKRVLWGGSLQPLVVSVILAFGVILGCLLPAPASAQVSKGSASGSLVDASGAAVAGASIKFKNRDTGEEASTVTDASGLFRVTLLSIGQYNVEVSKQGFRKLALSGITINSGAESGLGALRLEVGDIAMTVEVKESAQLVDSTEAQISTAFSTTDITTFPGVLENQGLDTLALYVPGVVSTRDVGFSNTNGAGFAVEGIRGRNNDQQIDGQNNNDNSVGGPGLFLSDAEFVQEYQLTTNNFGAEYGRNSGSVVNILTKSGTNTVHGSIYGTEGNSGLDALTNTQKFYEGLTAVPHYNDAFAGATVGGAMYKDKLFYFGGFDTEIIPQSSVYSTGSLTPTPAGIAQLQACFPGSTSLATLSKYGPYGVSAGNPTPVDPHMATLTATTKPTDPANSPNDLFCNYEVGGVKRTLPTGSHQYNWIYKMDLNTEKNHFYGRYLYNKSTFFNADSFGTAAAGYPVNVPALSQDYGFSWVRTLSVRMANEFRASYGRLTVGFGGNSIGNTVPPDTGISGALANVATGSGNLGFGPATSAPQGRIVNTYQFQDNWTYTLGRHAIKAGANFTYQRSPNFFLPNNNGSFSYTNWVRFAANLPSSDSITAGSPSLDFREHDTFLYVQDDFKLKNNFTLTMGLTWSYYGQPANLFHQKTTKQQDGSDPFWNPGLPLSVTTFPSIPAPKNSFGPNVGFAWTPGSDNRLLGHGKTTLRGGYRYSYDPPVYNIYLNISSAAPNVLAQTIRTVANPNPMLAFQAPALIANPFGPAVRTAFAGDLTPGVADPRTFNETTVSPNFGPQKTSRWSFGIQRELTTTTALEVRYVGNHAGDLFQSINANPYIAGIASDFPNALPSGVTPCAKANAVVASAVGRVNCNEGVVRERTNTSYSNYEGVEAELRTNNLWHQLTMRANYTYSKTMSNADEIFGTNSGGGAVAFAQNPLNFTNGEYGLSALDFPNRITLVATEQLPFFRQQHGPIGHVIGGWAVGAAYIYTSGQPYTPVQFSLADASGAFNALGNPYQDISFSNAFVGNFDGGARPFVGSLSAPSTQVGVYAGDACNIFGSGCNLDPTMLLSFNALNASGGATVTPVAKSAVRVIVNGFEADQIAGTPFGNAARNSLRDAPTDNVNLTIFKTINFWERVKLELHFTMLNAFNHPQFGTIDPFVDDAGTFSEGTGFANPYVQSGGARSLRVGIRIVF
jgi:hypothetical protein